MNRIALRMVLVAILAMLTTQPATAYLGPALIGAVFGPIFAVIGGVVMLLGGLFWYPVRRLLARRRAKALEEMADEGVPPQGDSREP